MNKNTNLISCVRSMSAAIIITAFTALSVLAEPSDKTSEHALPAITDLSSMTVYKTPTCGCCGKWVDHVNENGFKSKVVELNELSSIKKQYSIQGRYQSCHTGVVSHANGDYIFEGHIPSEYIHSFLANPPKNAIGLSVPGMPLGSPGMEVGDRKDYYQVLQLNTDGSSVVYAHVNKK